MKTNHTYPIFESDKPIFTKLQSYGCPVRCNENVELIPLNLDEKYEYELESNRSLEIKFSTRF
jgi:hypothetical protein